MSALRVGLKPRDPGNVACAGGIANGVQSGLIAPIILELPPLVCMQRKERLAEGPPDHFTRAQPQQLI
eukprot:3225016-Pyramimonas_sp.AAC.2